MKNILSVIAGLITGVILIFLLEMLVPMVYPPPPGLDFTKADRETMEMLMSLMPLSAMIFVLANYAIASLAGGLVSSLISKKMGQPLMVGGFLTVANIFNLVEIPHPLWMAVTSMLVFLPFAFVGGKIGMRLGINRKSNNS